MITLLKMDFVKKWKTGCGASCGITNQTDVSQVVGTAAAFKPFETYFMMK